MSELINIKEKLTKSGLKVTHQRLIIYDYLIKAIHHPTAESIYEEIKDDNPSISLGTVHKTLDTFIEVGLVRKVSSTDNKKRFDANMEKHNHIYFENSKEIIDYHDDELQKIILNYLEKKELSNIEIKDIQLQINAKKIDERSSVSIK